MTAQRVLRRGLLLALPALLAARSGRAAAVRSAWHDATRDRDLPVLIRLPETPGPRPLVLLSHGLGGSREGLAYLGRALAGAGFVAVHLQHPGTDAAVWQGVPERAPALAAAALDVANAVARLQDGIFAVEEVVRRGDLPGDPLEGRVDAGRLAAAGHSYGAWLVQHLLGQRLPGGDRGLRLPERRLKAGILLSPSPPRGLPPRLAFARVTTPMLHVTGTADHGWVEGATPADREVPFRVISGAPQVLVVLEGARHAAFADEQAAGPRWSDPTYHARVAAVSVLFLRAMLAGEAAARARLAAGAPALLEPDDRLETSGF
ncbi:alpha/beta hydrolase family protein [Falsiroseomonas bella]|uniref:alpha/beta hydrolase family protein n=1 Tax=Falsiroseomonas bella TaxID=2184016 RepID=UPI001E3D2A3B|nr:acetylhydrolase [Falsiroseomonas bella]